MLLSELFENQPAIEIDGFMLDSRDKIKNSLFGCLSGLTNDAHQYVNEAISNGAIAIVHSKELKEYQEGIVYIKVDDVNEIFPSIINKFYNNPSSKLWLIGVTGTNGKTTISWIIKQLLDHFKNTGYIGTLGINYGSFSTETAYTTSDLVSNSEILIEMLEHKVEAVSMEVSSQGLEQNRVAGMHFDVALFSNLSHDHLDFHLNMENYYQAKKSLFTSLEYGKPAIINIDDEYGQRLAKELVFDALTISGVQDATYRISDIELKSSHSRFVFTYEDESFEIETSFLGRFNVMNLAQAIAAVHQSGIALEDIVKHVAELENIPGRMESVNEGQDYSVIVDFAHTPDGFEKILTFAKDVTPQDRRIIVVFGSPGKRDKQKRLQFGHITNEYADMIILTEDDNRDELVRDIAYEIAKGITDKPYLIVENRFEAIAQALMLANKGDTVLLLAKGSESFMAREFGNEDYMGDKMAASEILKEFNEENENEN